MSQDNSRREAVASSSGKGVVAYVDGFNLYYGLKARGWLQFRWLDVEALVRAFVRPPDHLVATRYFTARSFHPPARYARHSTYLEALRRGTGVHIVEGRVATRTRTCPACRESWKVPQEKHTDINVASAMLCDAFDGLGDEAYLLSADSDLVPVVQLLMERWGREVTLITPPRRKSDELEACVARSLHIRKSRFASCQLPDPVVYTHRGKDREISRPVDWGPDSL